MLMRGSGSGIREPLKANSRGKVLDLSVEIAIFFLQRVAGMVIG
jgi:hypothetical protein